MSYQATTFTVPPTTVVRPASKIDEYGDLTTSLETSGSSLYRRIPSSAPASARSRKIWLISSAEVGRIAREASSARRPTFAQLGSDRGEVVQISQEPYLGRNATPLVARDEPQLRIPELVSVGGREGLSHQAPIVTGAVEGRVLDDRETAAPAVVDDSNLTYDGAGQRVFRVFTPARNRTEDVSLVES